MYHLGEIIDEYTEELFVDLGLTTLPEEKKADLFARIEEHLHKVILDTLAPILGKKYLREIEDALEQENYQALGKIMKRFPLYQDLLEDKIEEEFKKLKKTIIREHLHARETESNF